MAGFPVLIVVGGLPATGKSTVASALVRRTGFAYVRVDRIEQAIVGSSELRAPLGPVGYQVAYEVAAARHQRGRREREPAAWPCRAGSRCLTVTTNPGTTTIW